MAESLIERGLSGLSTTMTIAVPVIGAILYFGRVETGLSAVQAAQIVATARLDKIEDGRNVGLQRLARAEEAVAGLQATLTKIDAKLDRVLTRGR